LFALFSLLLDPLYRGIGEFRGFGFCGKGGLDVVLGVRERRVLDDFGFSSQKNDSIAHFFGGLGFSYGFQPFYAFSYT